MPGPPWVFGQLLAYLLLWFHPCCRCQPLASSLRWPEGRNETGKYGVPYLELLILCERWLEHRLVLKRRWPNTSARAGMFPSFPSPVSEGVPIRKGCQFLGSLFRSLAKLDGCLGKFIPCLTSKPLESCLPDSFGCLHSFLGCPAGSVSHLVNGNLRIRYVLVPFARRLPLGSLVWGFFLLALLMPPTTTTTLRGQATL